MRLDLNPKPNKSEKPALCKKLEATDTRQPPPGPPLLCRLTNAAQNVEIQLPFRLFRATSRLQAKFSDSPPYNLFKEPPKPQRQRGFPGATCTCSGANNASRSEHLKI